MLVMFLSIVTVLLFICSIQIENGTRLLQYKDSYAENSTAYPHLGRAHATGLNMKLSEGKKGQ